MRTRVLTVAVGSLALVFGLAGPAMADQRGGAYVDDDGDPTATAEDSTTTPVNHGGGDGPRCVWRVAIDDDFEFKLYDVATGGTLHSATGRWLEKWCDYGNGMVMSSEPLVPEGGAVDLIALANQALASVQIAPPAIRTSPSESGRLYVQVPTWLWLESSWWQPYEATAQAGRVWSTVTVRPVLASWSMGDGKTVPCAGPGVPWTPGAPEGGSDCTHIYRRASVGNGGGNYSMTVTVTLEVTWTSNAPGGGGTLPDIARISALEVEVGEIQAVGTRGGA